VSINELKKKIKDSKVLVVDVGTPWCGPCKVMDPIVDKVATKLGDKAQFAKVDAMEEPEIATEYRIQSVPTFLVFKNGKLVDNLVGAMSESNFETKIRNHIRPREQKVVP